jgi:hypothetical protein
MSETRQALIQRYKDGHRVVAEAVAGASDAELDARVAPDKWSPREIVHHLADSEMTSAIRLRRLVAEDQPTIIGYDQEEYARKLHYDRPIAASLDALRTARATTAEILELLTDAEWARTGTHSESGVYTMQRWLEIYADHAHNHADQIRRARAAATATTR